MAKTSLDIKYMAARHLGVLSQFEPLQEEDLAAVTEAYDAAIDLLTTDQGLTLPADLEATPDGLALAISRLVGVLVAPYFVVVPPEREARAIGRCRSYLLPDDREDIRDADGDGLISEDEEDAGQRALFY